MEDQLDANILKLFRKRKGLQTRVILKNGNETIVNNIIFEYVDNNKFAKITTNKKPLTRDGISETFFSNDVSKMVAIETKIVIYDDKK